MTERDHPVMITGVLSAFDREGTVTLDTWSPLVLTPTEARRVAGWLLDAANGCDGLTDAELEKNR